MQYKILESLGVEIENTDDAAFNNFLVSGESGIIKGVLDECKLVDLFGTVAIAKGELMIQGFRIKITEAYQYTPVGSAASRTNYHIVARLTLHEGGDVSFNIVTRTITELQQDDLHKLSSGIHEVELARFTHYNDSILNLTPSIGFLTLAPILKPEFAESEEWLAENGDKTKLYVLPDGFVWAWTFEEKIVGGYNNIAEPLPDNKTDTSKWINNCRISSSGLDTTSGSATNKTVCNPIPIKTGAFICVKGVSFVANVDRIMLTAEPYTTGNQQYVSALPNSEDGYGDVAYDLNGDVHVFTINNAGSTFTHIRFAFTTPTNPEEVIITVNQEIKDDEVVKEYAWANTNHSFVPNNYDEEFVTLNEEINEAKANIVKLNEANKATDKSISELNKRIDNIEEGSTSVPEYWKSAIATAKETITQKQALGGVNCVSFAWASDIHVGTNFEEKGKRFASVVKTIMDETNLPLFVVTGDIQSQASHSNLTTLYAEQDLAQKCLSAIPFYQQALIMGNHDGAWGDITSGYYKKQLSLDIVYNLLYRKQAMDFRRVSGDNGTYYYIDNMSQKMRFIMLNSNNTPPYDGDNADGTAKYDRFTNGGCYCETQLKWLCNVVLNMPDDYTACIFGHEPYPRDYIQLIGIVDAYNTKSQYNNTYTDSYDSWRDSTINVDFSEVKGKIAAVFAGHTHIDTIRYTNNSPMYLTCPLIITTNSLGGEVRDGTTRTDGTDTEFAMDIVTIDKATQKIYMTRLGAGVSRETSY